MDSHSWEGQAEAEHRSRVTCGYVIVWPGNGMSFHTFATNPKDCWDKFCPREMRKGWKAQGARCVPAQIVAEYPAA